MLRVRYLPFGCVVLVMLTSLAGAQSAPTQAGGADLEAPQPQPAPKYTDAWDVLPANFEAQNHLGLPLLKHLAADQKQFWIDGGTKWNAKKAKQFAPFAGFTAALIASDSWLSKQVPTGEIKRSQTVSNYGVYSLIGAGGGAFLWGALTNNDHLREAGFLSGETAVDSTLITYAFKGLSQRPRPNHGDGSGQFFQGGASFPSEHAAIAWSVASVMAHEYPGPLTKLLAYGLASAVTVTRVTGKEHFPSDVVVGSALGWYMGRHVYNAHHNSELGGAPWGTVHWKSESERPRVENMGSPSVPLDSWIYPALERLAALGYVSSGYLGQRPWTRMQCAQMLDEARDQLTLDTGVPQRDGNLYSALMQEFSPELGRIGGAYNVGLRVDSLYTRVTGISGAPLRDSFNFGQTIVNDYGRPYSEGFNTYDGATVEGEAGPLFFSAQAEYQHAPSTPSYPSSTLQAIAGANFTGVLPNGTAATSRFQLLTATAGVTWHNTQFSFGNQSLWLGVGESGALLMSNNAEPIPMLRIQSVTPYRIPLLSSILGPVSAEFFVGQLSGHHWEVNSPNVVGPNIAPQPFIHGEKLSFKPTRNLELGMGVTAMFAGPGLPFTWSNFLRTYYVHSPNAATNPGKRTSEFDIGYRLHNFITLYLDSMVVDEFSPIGSSRPTLNPGIYLPRLPKLPHLELRAEGFKEPLTTEFSPGFVYFDARRYLDGYTNDGLLMGSWIGRAGRGGQGWLTYWFSPRSKLQFSYRHQEVSKDFIGGGRLVDYSLAGQTMLRKDLELSGSMQYEQWHFPDLAAGRHSNLTTSVQLTFLPHWKLSR